MTDRHADIEIVLNGERVAARVEARTSIADFVRDRENLTGTHLACEHGVCGACTVLVDDVPVRGCITLAAAVSGHEVRTIEAFEDDAQMAAIRQCFTEAHGVQCGFCTPGMLLMVRDLVRRAAGRPTPPDQAEIRLELAGNLCRCTGYAGIVKAVELALQRAR